jgi:hypothetical protein
MRLLSRNDAPGTHAEGWLDCRVGWRAFYTKSRGELRLTRWLQLSPGTKSALPLAQTSGRMDLSGIDRHLHVLHQQCGVRVQNSEERCCSTRVLLSAAAAVADDQLHREHLALAFYRFARLRTEKQVNGEGARPSDRLLHRR